MFEYLSEDDYGIIWRLAPEAIVECLASSQFNFVKPIMEKHAANTDLWKELCIYHFGITPLSSQEPKTVFYGEVCVKLQAWDLAEKYGSFNAFYHLSQQALSAHSPDAAIPYALDAARIHGAPGQLLCLQIYQALSDDHTIEASRRREYAKQGCHHLFLTQKKYDEPDSVLALENTGWGQGIKDEFDTIENFVAQKIGEFKQVLSDHDIQDIRSDVFRDVSSVTTYTL